MVGNEAHKEENMQLYAGGRKLLSLLSAQHHVKNRNILNKQ